MSDVKLYTFAGAAGCYVYEGDYKKLKTENDNLRRTAEELLRSVDCQLVNHHKADLHEYDEPCKAMLRIKAAISSPENP
jgi:hypothetical protein